MNISVSAYLEKIRIPASALQADKGQMCTSKFFYYELVSLGKEYEADIFG